MEPSPSVTAVSECGLLSGTPSHPVVSCSRLHFLAQHHLRRLHTLLRITGTVICEEHGDVRYDFFF